ncbi:helix-turn-helix domain-containing protein [Candidatus Omnitrophota bacterium]
MSKNAYVGLFLTTPESCYIITVITVITAKLRGIGMGDDILTAQDVCRYLKIPLSSLYQLARDRKIPAFRVGRHWRFKKVKIEQWVEGQENGK